MASVNVEGILRHLSTFGSNGKPRSDRLKEKAWRPKQEGEYRAGYFKDALASAR